MARLKYQQKRLEECPQKDKHTESPIELVEWSEWAWEMSKTHEQVECPGCGLWAIWVPKGNPKVPEGIEKL